MAYIEERNRSKTSPVWRVIWREGKDRHSETFKVYEKAIEFKAHVDASGQRCPPGWTPGYGWPGTFTPPLPAPVEGERSITTAAFVLASAGRRVKARAVDQTALDGLKNIANCTSAGDATQCVAGDLMLDSFSEGLVSLVFKQALDDLVVDSRTLMSDDVEDLRMNILPQLAELGVSECVNRFVEAAQPLGEPAPLVSECDEEVKKWGAASMSAYQAVNRLQTATFVSEP